MLVRPRRAATLFPQEAIRVAYMSAPKIEAHRIHADARDLAVQLAGLLDVEVEER